MNGDAENARYYRELAEHLRSLRDAFVALEKRTKRTFSDAVAARDARRLADTRRNLQP